MKMLEQTTKVGVQRKHKWKRQEALAGYGFILPAVLGFLLLCLLPILFSLGLSFTDWNVLTPPKYIGLNNYVKLFTRDTLFRASISATFQFAFLSTIFSSLYAFLLALLLNSSPGKAFFRTVFYLPTVVPAVASAVLWKWLYNPEFGLFNTVLSALGLPKSMFIAGQNTVIPSLVFMSMWGCGGAMVIYLAGLQGVPQSLTEAVDIDGGNYWHKLTRVILPMVSPVVFFNVLMSLVGAFQVFTQAYMMTNGGPNNKSLFYSYQLYRTAFQQNKMGYASAMGWVMFLIMIIFTTLFFRVFARTVYYEGGEH
jgi:multiple sugar transport system permease protein